VTPDTIKPIFKQEILERFEGIEGLLSFYLHDYKRSGRKDRKPLQKRFTFEEFALKIQKCECLSLGTWKYWKKPTKHVP